MADTGITEIKSLLDEQGRLWQEFKRTNDEALKAKADSKAVGDHEAKLAAIEARMAEIDEIKASLQSQLDDTAKKLARATIGATTDGADLRDEVKSFNDYRIALNRPGSIVTEIETDEYVAYKQSFNAFLRRGEQSLNKDEVKALQAGVDSDGGFLLPPPVIGRIVEKVYELTPIRGMVSVVNMSGNDIEGIEDLDEAGSGGWVSETAARNESTTPKVGKWRLEAHEMYAQPQITQRLLDDNAFNAETWLANKVASKFARVEADAFVNGDGVGKPRGLFAYPHAQTADSSRAWGTFESVKTGANGAFHTTLAEPLFDIVAAMKPAYLGNAKWLTTRAVVAALRKFKGATDGYYIWQPGMQLGQPDMLLGYPIVVSQDIPAHTTTGAISMAFGNFAECYTIADRIGIRTLRDPFTSKPYIRFYSTRRVGGGALNYEAVKFITFAA